MISLSIDPKWHRFYLWYYDCTSRWNAMAFCENGRYYRGEGMTPEESVADLHARILANDPLRASQNRDWAKKPVAKPAIRGVTDIDLSNLTFDL